MNPPLWQIAYEAYFGVMKANEKSRPPNLADPEHLHPVVIKAWEAAAEAVLKASKEQPPVSW
jgi:hypothetical protein